MGFKGRKIAGRVLSFILTLMMFSSVIALAGCSDNGVEKSGGSSSKQEQTKSKEKVDLGKLGFVTEFIKVSDSRVVGDAQSRAYILKNEDNQVYVLMGFYDESQYNLIGGTFEIVKLTDGFEAYRIYQCIDYKDNRNQGNLGDTDVFFYINGGSNNFYKCTLHRGKYSDGKVVEKNSITCEKIEIPGTVVNFQAYDQYGNFALNDQGEVYAWYNTLKESEYSDNIDDSIIGFTDAKRHDTPTKLPLKDIKDMCRLGGSWGRAYLTNSGEIYTKELSQDFVKLDDISDIQYMYPVEDSDDEVIGINSKSQIDVYYVGKFHTSGTTRVKQSSLSAVKAESPLPSSNYCFYRMEADGSNNVQCQREYYAFRTNDPAHGIEYYEYNHGVSLCQYHNIKSGITTEIDPTLDYVSMYKDTWFDKSGNLYWYNSANKNKNYIIATDVKAYSINDWLAYIGASFAEAKFDEGAGMSDITFIYHKDGSVEAYCKNQVEKEDAEVVELDAAYYGNGTYGALIPGKNGKYRVCNEMKEDGTYEVVQEIELPK